MMDNSQSMQQNQRYHVCTGIPYECPRGCISTYLCPIIPNMFIYNFITHSCEHCMHTDLCQPHLATLTPLQTPFLQRRVSNHRHQLHLFLPTPVRTQDTAHIGWQVLNFFLPLSLFSPSVLPLSSKQAPAQAPRQLFLSAGEEEREALPLFLALVQPPLLYTL